MRVNDIDDRSYFISSCILWPPYAAYYIFFNFPKIIRAKTVMKNDNLLFS